jgi:hypothetical protein
MGFIFRYMGMVSENQQKTTELLLQKQAVADDSADRANMRGSHIGRRVLVFTVLWVLCLAPFLGALIGMPTWSFALLCLPPLVFTWVEAQLRGGGKLWRRK